MRIVIEMELEVKIPEDPANLNEIFVAVQAAMAAARSQAATKAIQRYEEQIINTLCGTSGRQAKKGLGSHEKKGDDGKRCRYRTFGGAGRWSDERTLYGGDGHCLSARATSIIENLVRKLVRRLKKIGWNWSDAGAGADWPDRDGSPP